MDPIIAAKLAELGIGVGGAGLQAYLQKKENDYYDKFKSKRKLEDFLAAEELKKLDKQYSRHARKDLEKEAKEEYAKNLKELKEKYKGQSHRKSKTNYNNEKQVFKDLRDKKLAEFKETFKSKGGEYKTKEQAIRDKLKEKLHNLDREELEYRTTGKAPEWFGGAGSAGGPMGAAEGIGTYSTLTPEQQEASKEVLKSGLAGLGKYSPDFAPIAQKYRNEFASGVVPSLAERFSGLGAGAQKSSGFQQALGQAGAGLSENLAAAEQGYNQQALDYYKSLLGQGLKPQIESYYKPGDVARGGQYAGVADAFKSLGGGVGGILQYLGEKKAGQQQEPQQVPQQNPQTNGVQAPQFNPPAELSYMDIYRKNNPMLQF